jgi:hypothetical protein
MERERDGSIKTEVEKKLSMESFDKNLLRRVGE